MRTFVCALVALLVPALVEAHPGHGAGGAGVEHYLREPVHAAALAGLVVVAAVAITWRRRAARSATGRIRPSDSL